jgi:RNA polymerase sigma factor (sigma-70 family)
MSGTRQGRLRSPQRLSDEAVAKLVLAAGAGDQASWNALVDQFSGLLWAVARAHRLGEADAADVVQITWLRLVEHLDRLRNPAGVGGWLATCARRECVRILRASKRQVPMGDDFVEQPSLTPLPGEALARTERDRAIQRAFSLLPGRDQALLRLLTAEPSLSYEEIAAALGIPIGSIGPTRQRALERLRRLLDGHGITTQLAD